MLKISETTNGKGILTLRLEGRVIGPWVEELRRICEPFLDTNDSLDLDMAEVTYADREGVVLLHRLQACGATLMNCSPFVAQQIEVMAGTSGDDTEAR